MWRKRKNKNINNTVKKDKIKDNSNIKNINKTIVFDKIENINLKSKKNNSNKSRQIICDLNNGTFCDKKTELIKTNITQNLTEETQIEKLKEKNIKIEPIKKINKEIINNKNKITSKVNNSNINQKKGSLYKKSNIKSKNEFRTKEKEIEKQKMFLKTFTETEEKKKLRRGSIGRENKKYNLKQNSITIYNRISSLPDSKKI